MSVISRLAIAAALACGFSVQGGSAFALPDCGSGGNLFTYQYTGSIVSCEITSAGNYVFAASGANGGDQRIDNLTPTTFGGQGTTIAAVFSMHVGDILSFLIGGVGGTNPGELLSGEIYPGGGGGGTFIAILPDGLGNVPTALLVGGGGGGASSRGTGQGGRGIDGDPNQPNGNGGGDSAGAGGTNGNGGGGSTTDTGGAGGGGFYSDGGGAASATGGRSFQDGGAGGGPSSQFCFGAPGGFGGGGGAGWSDCTEDGGAGAGGGGGYSGGGGGGWYLLGNDGGTGGGGSSYYWQERYVDSLSVLEGFNPNSDGNGVIRLQQLTVGDVPIPEPAALSLLAAGLAAIGFVRRRRR